MGAHGCLRLGREYGCGRLLRLRAIETVASRLRTPVVGHAGWPRSAYTCLLGGWRPAVRCDMLPPMQRQPSRSRAVTSIVACAIGFLLGSCGGSSAPEVMSVSYSCAAPPGDLAGCSVSADCATVA